MTGKPGALPGVKVQDRHWSLLPGREPGQTAVPRPRPVWRGRQVLRHPARRPLPTCPEVARLRLPPATKPPSQGHGLAAPSSSPATTPACRTRAAWPRQLWRIRLVICTVGRRRSSRISVIAPWPSCATILILDQAVGRPWRKAYNEVLAEPQRGSLYRRLIGH